MNDKRVNQYLILPEAGQRKDTKLAVEYDEKQIAEYVAERELASPKAMTEGWRKKH